MRREPDDLPSQVVDLYVLGGLSTRRVAARLGISRRRVDRELRAAGVEVAARGAGRPRPTRRHFDDADLADRLRELYQAERLTRRQVSEKLGLSEGLVRTRLAEHGIPARTKGRYNREDRSDLPDDAVIAYYLQRGLTARAVGRLLGTSTQLVLRAAHELGLPVRPGAATARGVGPIELVSALYADPLVGETLDRHGIPVVPPGGPIWQRFPDPVPLTTDACTELYVTCGLSTIHIELLTGHPASAVRRMLHAAGVRLRPAGGRGPFLRRWEAAQRAP